MIVSGAAADAEISRVEPVSDDSAGLESFAYFRLGDEDFERLSYALAKRSGPRGIARTWDDAAYMVHGADAGRDVLLTKAGRSGSSSASGLKARWRCQPFSARWRSSFCLRA